MKPISKSSKNGNMDYLSGRSIFDSNRNKTKTNSPATIAAIKAGICAPFTNKSVAHNKLVAPNKA
jgi:hypothetical protein